MWTVIIFAIIGIAIGLIVIIKEWYWLSFIELIFRLILFLCVFSLVGWGVAWLLRMDTKTEVQSVYIESIQDGSSLSGRMYLFGGFVNGRMSYSFYYKEGDGYKLVSLDSKNVTIKYSTECKCDVYYKVKTDAFINHFAYDDLNTGYEYIIYVPQGTISNSFNLDAQ